MPSQSRQKPAFLVRSLHWSSPSSPSLPKPEVKQAKCTALRVPKIRASANIKVAASPASSATTSPVLKPLMLVEKLLKGEVVVPLPRSAKHSGLKPLVLIEKLARLELPVEVSHPPPVRVQELSKAPLVTEVVAEEVTDAAVVESPAEVVSAVVRQTIARVPQSTKRVIGSPKSLNAATPCGITKNIKATIGVKATKMALVNPGKESSAMSAKSKAGAGFKPRSSPRAIKDMDSIPKSKSLQVGKPSLSATSTSSKPVRSSTTLVASIVVPRVSVPKPTGRGGSIQARKQPLKPSAAVAHATSAPADGGKISLPAPISRSKSVNKSLAIVHLRAPAPSSRAKTTVMSSSVPSKPARPASSAVVREPEGGNAPTCSQVEIGPKPAAPSVRDVSIAEAVPVIPQQFEVQRQEPQQRALASILGDISNIPKLRARGASGGPSISELVPVISQQSGESKRLELQQRALANILGDISNMPKLRTQGASGGPSTPRASPRTELRTQGTDFIDELKDRLAARKSKLSGSITSFPKVSNTPESSQRDFRSVLRSASVSKRIPEARVEEVSELQRAFQRRGKKIAALASMI